MTPLFDWNTMDTVDDTAFNEWVNDVPSSMPIVITPYGTEFRGKSGQASWEAGRLTLVPVQGRYLHIRHQARSHDGSTASGNYTLVHSAGTVDLFTFGGITSGTFASDRITVDMEALTIALQTVDVTGDTCDLVLYLNSHAAVRCVQIYTGDGSADTDYGAI